MNKIDTALLNLFNAIDEAKRQLLDTGSLEMSSEVRKFERELRSHPDISRHLENTKGHTKHTLTEKDIGLHSHGVQKEEEMTFQEWCGYLDKVQKDVEKVLKLKNNKTEKPPLGLKPKYIHLEEVKKKLEGIGKQLMKERIKEIASALARHRGTSFKLVPFEWIEELEDLTSQL